MKSLRFIAFSALLIVVCCPQSIAQTATELAAKYPALSAYEIRPGIVLTARFANDGQACEMKVETRPYKAEGDKELNSKLEDELLEELSPRSVRGERTSRWLAPNSFVGGGVYHMEKEYEQIVVETDGFVSSGDVLFTIRWKHRKCAVATAKNN